MKYTDKKAYDKVVQARTVLLVSQPFFGCLALQLNLVEQPSDAPSVFRTMAVDGKNMYYYPDFVLGLSEQELTGVVAHEVMHCAFQHMTRRQHRNPVIWNMAGDYVINESITKAGLTLPGKPCHTAPKKRDPNDKTFYYLLDPKYYGMSTEEIYERIKDEVQKQLQKQKGQGQRGDGEGEGGGMVIPDTDLDLGDIDPGGCGGVLDAAGPGQKHEQDNVDREWEANVRMAVNVAKRAAAGNVPGYLERLVQNLEEPRVPWRELTKQFITTSMSKDYSWARPNRRFAHTGLMLPGFVPDSLHHMVFVVDTSGSISMEMLTLMGGEIGGALSDGTADQITVLHADTEVQHVDTYVPGDMVKFDKMHGGGGTCFNDTFRWIKENAPDTQCIVYLTDMLTGGWGEDLGIPTLWAAYLPHHMLASIKPPFGTVIPVDTSE